ncbi:MAG: hypothetical protein A4E29_00418 [Methanomassiliicoccales archaeon PtaB.Bin134]|nr:MAG: hypothetical protein A4E29_00418 [Methanomassiliicoccales archaeon PtaB.Bin134]
MIHHEPIALTQADVDFLAKKMGFKDLEEVRRKRMEEEEAAERARKEAEAKEILEMIERRTKAEDDEIAEALKYRVDLRVDGKVLKKVSGWKAFTCPECGAALPFARETLLTAVRRATFTTEMWFPQWCGVPQLIPKATSVDAIPAGGEVLAARPTAMIYKGRGKCACGHVAELELRVDCLHDGERVDTFKD